MADESNAAKNEPDRVQGGHEWDLALVVGCSVLASALACVALALAGAVWYWGTVLIVPAILLGGLTGRRKGGLEPLSKVRARIAWLRPAAVGMLVVAAMCAAAAGWWYSRHVWRFPKATAGATLLKGCSCRSSRGPLELLLTIRSEAPERSGQGEEGFRYEASWDIGVDGNTIGLRSTVDKTAPSRSFFIADRRLHVAMACTDEGVLVATDDRATLWDMSGKALASATLPVPIASSRGALAQEGTCDIVQLSNGALVLQGEGRPVRLVPTGMVLYVE